MMIMSQYFTFLLVVIATGCWAVARKKKTTESTASSSHRTSNYRIVIVSAISFFLGLQFSHLRDLLQTDFTVGGLNDDDATEYMTWVPDEMEYLARRNEGGVRQRRKPQRNNPFDHNTKKKTKKKVKPLPRYHDSNYTDFKPLPWSLPRPSAIRYQTSEEFMTDYIALKREKNTKEEKHPEKSLVRMRYFYMFRLPKIFLPARNSLKEQKYRVMWGPHPSKTADSKASSISVGLLEGLTAEVASSQISITHFTISVKTPKPVIH